jgi:hypothetical protein
MCTSCITHIQQSPTTGSKGNTLPGPTHSLRAAAGRKPRLYDEVRAVVVGERQQPPLQETLVELGTQALLLLLLLLWHDCYCNLKQMRIHIISK